MKTLVGLLGRFADLTDLQMTTITSVLPTTPRRKITPKTTGTITASGPPRSTSTPISSSSAPRPVPFTPGVWVQTPVSLPCSSSIIVIPPPPSSSTLRTTDSPPLLVETAQKKTVVYAHQSPGSFHRACVAVNVLEEQGHRAVASAFPMYWFSFLAIMNGWLDRVLVQGFAISLKNMYNNGIFKNGTLHFCGFFRFLLHKYSGAQPTALHRCVLLCWTDGVPDLGLSAESPLPFAPCELFDLSFPGGFLLRPEAREDCDSHQCGLTAGHHLEPSIIGDLHTAVLWIRSNNHSFSDKVSEQMFAGDG
ncbi:NAD(P)H dehydrogenase [quinone] 1 [Merluccius polli]|uniref:NAD(P)H dehydrogenase [quinone] 1 n=1 Tax=Merluccius polli TaxID=89951 RepID=A0AA47PD95_MERPO|nr:NAD(P)H dehydrogenase [quinone] 1 [Merluccius polli]